MPGGLFLKEKHMKCFDPVLCYTTSTGQKLYRHWSLASKIIRQSAQLVFNCGKCLHCRKKRAFELAARCVLHASLYEQNCFLTLTYDEKQDDYHNRLQYSDIQKFKKRLRKTTTGKKIEIFNVHEYGKNNKKHWHLIVFNHDFADKKVFTYKQGIPLYTADSLCRLWPYGFSTIGDVSEASAMYQSQYVQKDFKNGNLTNARKSCSRHSGIGKPYFVKHFKQLLRLGYVPVNGQKLPLPRYFEKLAHKHYAHYYETSFFFDTRERKARYRIFKNNEADKEIADLYIAFKSNKDEKILQIAKEWDEVINKYLDDKLLPDFVQSGKNALHDQKNRQTLEIF